MPVTSKSSPFLPQKFIPEFVGSFELSFSCSALQFRTPGSMLLIRSIRSTESIASINTNTINKIYLIDWHCRPHQPSCTTVVSFFYLPYWFKIISIVVLHTVLSCWYAHLCLIFFFCLPNQSYSDTHIIGKTDLPMKNGLLLCISRWAFSSGFILLTEPSSCVPGDINCNKEDLTIMSSLTQDDDNQSSDVLLYIL